MPDVMDNPTAVFTDCALAHLPQGNEPLQSAEQAWQQALHQLKQHLSPASYEMWCKPMRLLHADVAKATLVVQMPSEFSKSYLLANFRKPLQNALEAAYGQPMRLEWMLAAESDNEASDNEPGNVHAGEARPFNEKASPFPADTSMARQEASKLLQAQQAVGPRPWTPRTQASNLNPRYTFEQLVVGQHNRFPHAAAMAIADQPASTYNPFFVYGPAGLGKTHLVQAIGHAVLQNHTEKSVRYTTAEQFTNELIAAIGSKSTNAFRDRYRKGADILIIDDVQFLEGKERTQEELFHTFNSLYESGKQIILTSDRNPQLLTSLEERLRSRFCCGLMADVQAPDVETRIAILQLKAEREGLTERLALDGRILHSLAERYTGNIRELEGAFNKVAAYAMLTQSALSLSLLDTVLGGFQARQAPLSEEAILQQTARYFHLQARDLKGPNRSKEVSSARQVSIYLLREELKLSFPKIGEVLGGRKHATILYAYDKLSAALDKQPFLQEQINEIRQLLHQTTP